MAFHVFIGLLVVIFVEESCVGLFGPHVYERVLIVKGWLYLRIRGLRGLAGRIILFERLLRFIIVQSHLVVGGLVIRNRVVILIEPLLSEHWLCVMRFALHWALHYGFTKEGLVLILLALNSIRVPHIDWWRLIVKLIAYTLVHTLELFGAELIVCRESILFLKVWERIWIILLALVGFLGLILFLYVIVI